MGWTRIRGFAASWDLAAHTGRLHLWLDHGSVDPQAPDERLENLPSEEFAALCAALGSDRNREIFFDPDARVLNGGIEWVARPI
jgi:hypothetical protein